MAVMRHEQAVRKAAEAIWPMDGLSDDQARQDLFKDTERAIETYLDATGLRGAVDLAERYGEAIIAISAALPNVNRVRAIIASLDTDGGQ
jgi:hypothetical protein